MRKINDAKARKAARAIKAAIAIPPTARLIQVLKDCIEEIEAWCTLQTPVLTNARRMLVRLQQSK